ncbi:MAG: peptidoglycan bridge formation glycyltransferase FemA/FemB family protein [Candidatus Roizmanbacteria bacterium]
MSISIIPDTYNTEHYNRVSNHPLQSWQWGEARKAMGIQVVRIGVFDNANLHQVFQMTIHKIPKFPYYLGYIPRSITPSPEVLTFLHDYSISHNIIFIKIEPDDSIAEEVILTHFSTKSFQIVKSPHSLFSEWTMEMNISSSEEDLIKQMKPKTRYNIRLAQKKGVTVKEESNETGFKIFCDLYFDTCRRQRYFGHSPNYHEIVWNHMKEGIAHIIIAYYDNTPLASYELFHFHNKLYYPYGGTSDLHRNVMPANLIMWEAIMLGKKLGANYFDMWGSLAPGYAENHTWAGFTRFKEGYGAQFVQKSGSFDLIVNTSLYTLYNQAHKLRSIFLKLKR